MINALERHLNSRSNTLGSRNSIPVFLINEFLWIEIRFDDGRASVSRALRGPGEASSKVFTTRRVLDNLLNGTITWRQSIDDGLIASRCIDGCPDEPLAFLSRAFSAPGQDTQASIEQPREADAMAHTSAARTSP